MTEDLFLDWALKLLEQIETSEEKKLWCRRYSVYSRSPGQKTLSRDLHDFVDRTYQAGLVIQNYHEVIQKWGLEERNIAIAPPGWLETQPYLCVLACIAWHFRRDHFCEGSLISQSIAEGVLLRLFRRLKALCPTAVPAVTLQELCCNDCHSVPEVPGVYWVLAPEGMLIRFSEQEYRPKAKIYPAKKLQEKYDLMGASVFAYIFGCFAALVLGGGMCLTMLIESSIPAMVGGIVLGLVGIALCGVNYVIYKKLVEKKTKSLLPVIDQTEEKLANTLEKGNDLLRAEFI